MVAYAYLTHFFRVSVPLILACFAVRKCCNYGYVRFYIAVKLKKLIIRNIRNIRNLSNNLITKFCRKSVVPLILFQIILNKNSFRKT
jgi:hypothetical protein